MGRTRGILSVLALCAPLPVVFAAQRVAQQPEFDVLIRGGTVVDGTGAARFRADIGIKGDRIARVSPTPLEATRGRRVLDATNLIVAPGFIDAHAHVDNLAQQPLAESFIRQGVTTVIYAADGGMPWPLAAEVTRLQSVRHVPNIVFFAGFNTIRSQVVGGSASRAPTAPELERMKAMVAQAMDEGAIGLSAGLRYVPAIYAETEEVIALARVAAERGGIYASHMRDEGAGSLASVRELIRIAREAGMPAQITHHKLMGQPQWGQSVQTLALVDSARAQGLDITIDAYPYDATSTGTAALFPAWALAGGGDSLRLRLADPAQRARVEAGMKEIILEERGGGDLARMRIARYGPNLAWNGKTFADIAKERQREPNLDFAVELGIEIQTRGGASGVWHVVNEDDIRRILRHPWTMISSDGGIGVPSSSTHPHPRNYGAHARVLGRYVRDEKVLTLEEAIRKMATLPAARFSQGERGRIAEGMFADIAVFDPATVRDLATYDAPHQYSVGMKYVVVNGDVVLSDGAMTGERPGRVLKKEK